MKIEGKKIVDQLNKEKEMKIEIEIKSMYGHGFTCPVL